MSATEPKEYQYTDSSEGCSHKYLLPTVLNALKGISQANQIRNIFEIGCGNGSFAKALKQEGFAITAGVDFSSSGIEVARRENPEIRFEVGSAYDDLRSRYGTFSVVISLEVIEHLYSPRKFAKSAFDLLEPGGKLIVSTPFHGYFKNLALALTGKMDQHFTALWDHGHIKFWSKATLRKLFEESGFQDIHFRTSGRIPIFAKSIVVIASRQK